MYKLGRDVSKAIYGDSKKISECQQKIRAKIDYSDKKSIIAELGPKMTQHQKEVLDHVFQNRQEIKLKKNGTPDMRYKVNKILFNNVG